MMFTTSTLNPHTCLGQELTIHVENSRDMEQIQSLQSLPAENANDLLPDLLSAEVGRQVNDALISRRADSGETMATNVHTSSQRSHTDGP
jgi:hypothetical protein